jgi:hypothetical protein
MLNHQNMLAQVNEGSRCRATSQILGACTSRFDCRQSLISHSSRKYHPLPTTPCTSGVWPVRYVACTEQVTAGNTGCTADTRPRADHSFRKGVCSPISRGVRPTTFNTTVFCMGQRWEKLVFQCRPFGAVRMPGAARTDRKRGGVMDLTSFNLSLSCSRVIFSLLTPLP